MSQHTVYSWESSMCTWEECVFCCIWMECSVQIYQIHLVQCFIQGHCILVDFLYGWTIRWCKWVLKSPTIIVLLSISPFRSVNVCFKYCGAPMLGAYILIMLCLLDELPSSSSYTIHFCVLLPFLAWSLFCLRWIWLHPLSSGCHLLGASPSIPSLWACVCLQSWGEPPGGSFSWVLFFNPLCVFWLVTSTHLYLGWLLIDENLVLPFYFLFSGCSTSPLFLFSCVSVCHFGLVVFSYVFLSFLFFVSCLCSRFMFCRYHEVCIKCFWDKMVFFSADSILSSFTYMGSVVFLFPFCVFVVSNYLFLCCEFVTKLK